MIRFLIYVYTWIIIVDAVMSYLPQYQSQQWVKIVKQAAGYTLNPVRKLLPNDLPIDISPIIVLIILQILPALW